MEKRAYWEVIKEPGYMQYLAGVLISRFGDSVDAIAYSWVMYEVTGNASLIALILGLNYLPTVCLQPFAGVLVEGWEKKKVVAVTSGLRGGIVVGTAILFLTGQISAAYLMAATLLTSSLEAFSIPAGSALVPKLVTREKMTAAKALSSSLGTVVELAGTALAGTIIAAFGTHTALFLDAVTFGVSAGLIWGIRYREERRKETLSLAGYKTEFREGLSYIKSHPTLLCVMTVGMALNVIFVPFSSFQTIFAAEYLKLDAQALSVFGFLSMGGMFCGSAAAPWVGQKLGDRKGIVAGGLLMSPLYLICGAGVWAGLTAGTIYLTAGIGMFLTGGGIGVVSVLFSALFVKQVEDGYMARVSGLTNACLTSMMPTASFLCSIAALFWEVPVIFAAVGIMNLLLYVIVGKSRRFACLEGK